MNTYIDSTGNVRPLRITIAAADKIFALAGVDILSGKPAEIARLFDEPLTRAKAIAAVVNHCDPTQTIDALLDAMDGDTFADASNSFFLELTYFFRQSRRTDLATMLEEMESVMRAGIREAEEAYRNRSGSPSGTLPEPSESTQES